MQEAPLPVDPEASQLLRDLKAIVDSQELPMLLIGARARILAFDRQYAQGRATQDWDIAVRMDDWSRYEALVTQMTTGATAQFQKTAVVHKFIHLNTGLELDLIPFGGISNDRQEILWSDGNQMSVLGLPEAFSTAKIEAIGGIELRILDYPALVGLKLLSWYERQEIKDLADITHVLQNFQDDERINTLFSAIEAGQLDYESAASALIGQDMRSIFQANALEQIGTVLARIIQGQNQYLPQFIRKDLDEKAWDVEFDRLVNRFKALQYGLSV
jgi:predicted nucleotidyltransferase